MSISDQDLRDAFDMEREETMRAEVVRSFKGRQRWLLLVMWIGAVVIFAASVWSAVRFFQTDPAEVRDLLLFATVFLWGSMGIGMVKTMYSGRLDRNAIRRDIRRLELHLERLEQA